MSAAPSLYRRHRPRSFADVVGQEHIVRTLRNAIELGKVHHAYLFVGSRGTGKTSMAKILAACLNCERGPSVSPCGTCASMVVYPPAGFMPWTRARRPFRSPMTEWRIALLRST